jgi:hypothetical protein
MPTCKPPSVVIDAYTSDIRRPPKRMSPYDADVRMLMYPPEICNEMERLFGWSRQLRDGELTLAERNELASYLYELSLMPDVLEAIVGPPLANRPPKITLDKLCMAYDLELTRERIGAGRPKAVYAEMRSAWGLGRTAIDSAHARATGLNGWRQSMEIWRDANTKRLRVEHQDITNAELLAIFSESLRAVRVSRRTSAKKKLRADKS